MLFVLVNVCVIENHGYVPFVLANVYVIENHGYVPFGIVNVCHRKSQGQ
jgi:hypothetical protein